MSVIIALLVVLVFFLLIGKFVKYCYQCNSSSTEVIQPYYVVPNPMPTTNTAAQPISNCPTYDNAVATTTIAVGHRDFGFASPMTDLRYPTSFRAAPQYDENRAEPTPPSYYEDPPPSYDQVCGIMNSTNKYQSRKI